MADPRITRFSAGALATGLLLVTLLGAAASQQEQTEISVPSGQALSLYEKRVVAPENKILYLGFLAEALGGEYGVTFDRASIDMDTVCEEFGIPLAGELIGDGYRIDEIVVRLMERPIDYGAVDETAAQFLNAYDISGGTCEWF
ncbi:MAG: hypothetical protein GYB24_00260 [Rhodobacteraceae bacterium]|nr:hypothetical protein [Paracoccaceae bacterium]